MCVTATRFIIAPSAGETQPYVINIAGTAANLVVKANWTVTTSGSTTANTQGLFYGPTANAGAGRTCLVKDGALATASALFSLDEGGDTSWAAGSGGSTMTHKCGCWSGTKGFVFASTFGSYKTSADLATWADQTMPMADGSGGAVNCCASDGKATVVVAGAVGVVGSATLYGLMVSKDDGATWQYANCPDTSGHILAGAPSRIDFINGKFIATFAAGLTNATAWVSIDGVTWVIEPISRGRGVNIVTIGYAFKAGVYCGINATATGALTATEDMSKFRIPMLAPRALSAVGKDSANSALPLFVKARTS